MNFPCPNVILVLVVDDPKSEFRADQFTRHIAGAKQGKLNN
jgi:hypothetical protein